MREGLPTTNFFFLRQPSKPIALRPVAKRGRVGNVDTVVVGK